MASAIIRKIREFVCVCFVFPKGLDDKRRRKERACKKLYKRDGLGANKQSRPSWESRGISQNSLSSFFVVLSF
jgi:hypothetical protein